MLNDFTGADKIYIACGYTDLRRGIDGLAAIIQQEFKLDPFTNALFLFCGRRRDRIKALYWEGNGFVLLYKRLEAGAFQWPRKASAVRAVTPQSESYMWLYRTSGDTDKPVVLFEYQPGRGAKYPAAFLKDFQGCLHADGYAVYQKLPNVTLSICWAHARRKFDEAVKSQPKSRAKGSPASQGLAYCDLLFRIEDSLAEENAEGRLKQRQKQAKPVLDAMFAWANLQKDKTAPKSAFGKALTFLINQWPYLTNYLKDGRLELSNNRAERSIKPFVMGRKNWLFANAQAGAQSSAVIYSLIETAMENKLDPYRYLTWLLKTANTADLTDEQTVKRLLPWNTPDECAARRRT